MAGENDLKTGDLSARVESLSPRRLMILTGLFVAALATLIFLQLRQETEARKTETALRIAAAASDCAGPQRAGSGCHRDAQTQRPGSSRA